MGLFNILKKERVQEKTEKQQSQKPDPEEEEEYEVPTFKPKPIPRTAEMMQRKRGDDIRKRYCGDFTKTGIMQ